LGAKKQKNSRVSVLLLRCDDFLLKTTTHRKPATMRISPLQILLGVRYNIVQLHSSTPPIERSPFKGPFLYLPALPVALIVDCRIERI
jgi:hypothetical protein